MQVAVCRRFWLGSCQRLTDGAALSPPRPLPRAAPNRKSVRSGIRSNSTSFSWSFLAGFFGRIVRCVAGGGDGTGWGAARRGAE
jgi:hypothetical protein